MLNTICPGLSVDRVIAYFLDAKLVTSVSSDAPPAISSTRLRAGWKDKTR